MMSKTKPKSKKIASEPLEIESPIENAVNKKASKKPSIATSAEAAEVVDTVVSDVVTSSKKRKKFKPKVIRDSFPFPEQDYQKLSELKKACLAAGIHVKKGELLRAGLYLITKLSLEELKLVASYRKEVGRTQTKLYVQCFTIIIR